MKLLLAYLLGTVIVGLITNRLDRWTYTLIVTGAVGVTVLYFGMRRFWS